MRNLLFYFFPCYFRKRILKEYRKYLRNQELKEERKDIRNPYPKAEWDVHYPKKVEDWYKDRESKRSK